MKVYRHGKVENRWLEAVTCVPYLYILFDDVAIDMMVFLLSVYGRPLLQARRRERVSCRPNFAASKSTAVGSEVDGCKRASNNFVTNVPMMQSSK